MRMPLKSVVRANQTSPAAPASSLSLRRKCARDSESNFAQYLGTQRQAVGRGEPPATPPVSGEPLNSPGQPLEASTRRFMESRFSHDFSRVRVHTDARAAESARGVRALAYTVGNDVVFGQGNYAPDTTAGRRLLAHELTHVVQQRNGAALPNPPAASSAHEAEARQVAEQIMSNQPSVRVRQTAGTMIAKDDGVLQQPSNTAQAVPEKEWDAPKTGLYFNGNILALRRNGDVVFQVGAHSGRSNKDYDIGDGPIPDGNRYFLSPHITKPPVTTYQSDGMAGARGIDSGYQQILDSGAQGAWGAERIAIEPANVCAPLPPGAKEELEENAKRKKKKLPYCSTGNGQLGVYRGGFYLHGGSGSTTSGCIKVHDAVVFQELRKSGGTVPLTVKKLKG